MTNIVNTFKNKFIVSQSNLINLSIILIFLFPITIITGPFLPDLVLSSLALIGLYSFIRGKIKFVLYKETFILWLFYIFIIISSLTSDQPVYSLDYTLFYFRFIIFSHYFLYLLINFENSKRIFLYGILSSLCLIIISSTYQLLLISLGFHEVEILRLKLPFSDEEVVGSFIVRMLPILFFFIYINNELFKSKIFIKFTFGLVIFSSIIIIFSGERAAITYLILLSFMIFFTFIKENFKLISIIFISFLILFGLLSVKNEKIKNRILQDFERNTSLDPSTNVYFNYSLVSIEMVKDSLIVGKGPKMFRVLCDDEKFNDYPKNCNMHPHNLYFQLLAETGIIGFLFLFIPYVLIFIKFSKNFFMKQTNTIFQLASIGFLINFFPFVPSGNFFNNWLNTLFYLPIILLVYSFNINKKLE